MTTNITLPREVVEQALDMLGVAQYLCESWRSQHHPNMLETYNKLRAALVTQSPARGEAATGTWDHLKLMMETDVDWQAVGRIIDAHSGRGQLVAGTSNWGAMIYRACHGIGANYHD